MMWYKNRISVPVLLVSLNTLVVLPGFSQSFEKMAHRGGSALMPENTIIAMQNAMDFGVGLEMDLYLSKDKKVFVYHDDKISPKFGSNPDGTPVTQEQAAKKKIIDFTYAELKPYDLGMRAHPDFPRRKRVKAGIPLLTELIDSVESYARRGDLKLPNYSMEIKVPNASLAPRYKVDLVDSVIQIISAKSIPDRVIIQSFDIETLEYLHQQYPDVKTAYLVGQGHYLDNLKKLSFTPTAYSPPYQLVTPELIAYCHTKNMLVVTWTVNNKKDIERLKQMGVDVVMSDYPDYFLP
ncbi:glycerophosphodiester phosphodiesterase family protein [Flavihumibacter sp. UBA7668]|uniref:glycerophosphodiester phosphodiesterase family protein n=1 Tax=Flavihumibacter sp. UBA7668 TaxID=1946542 RepID=UPI0025C6FD4D|nr:glycerophosphodiester phosphodiesterase family protein [Flavihumibacter sp. UBA7668]